MTTWVSGKRAVPSTTDQRPLNIEVRSPVSPSLRTRGLTVFTNGQEALPSCAPPHLEEPARRRRRHALLPLVPRPQLQRSVSVHLVGLHAHNLRAGREPHGDIYGLPTVPDATEQGCVGHNQVHALSCKPQPSGEPCENDQTRCCQPRQQCAYPEEPRKAMLRPKRQLVTPTVPRHVPPCRHPAYTTAASAVGPCAHPSWDVAEPAQQHGPPPPCCCILAAAGCPRCCTPCSNLPRRRPPPSLLQ